VGDRAEKEGSGIWTVTVNTAVYLINETRKKKDHPGTSFEGSGMLFSPRGGSLSLGGVRASEQGGTGVYFLLSSESPDLQHDGPHLPQKIRDRGRKKELPSTRTAVSSKRRGAGSKKNWQNAGGEKFPRARSTPKRRPHTAQPVPNRSCARHTWSCGKKTKGLLPFLETLGLEKRGEGGFSSGSAQGKETIEARARSP